MERDCKIVQDLLPNYLEKTTSKETNQYIEEHIKQCPKCSKICNAMKEELNISCSLDTEKEVNYMKKFNGKMKRLELWKKIAKSLLPCDVRLRQHRREIRLPIPGRLRKSGCTQEYVRT